MTPPEGRMTLQDARRAYNAAVEGARLAMEATPRVTHRTDHRVRRQAALAVRRKDLLKMFGDT